MPFQSPLVLSLTALVVTLIAIVWRKVYPTPYPGIPYKQKSAGRIAGDIPDMVPVTQATNEFSDGLFSVTTRELGVPIAQFLFPGIRNPLIVLEDPREIEDITLRRNKEFDKAPMAIDILAPMFPRGSISQYTTPELKAQKRLWADVMGSEFLRKAAAPNIYKATLELLDLWRLKASLIDHPFSVHEDFQNVALDAIWVAVVGEEPGVTRHEIHKLRSQNASHTNADNGANSSEPPREIGSVMRNAVERFQRLEIGNLEAGEFDTCMMDLVLRCQVVEAKKAKRPLTDPTKDQNMLDEMFVMLVGGHDSTANALTWCVRYMEAFPDVQDELRTALKAAFSSVQPPVEEILSADVPYLDATCEEGFRLAGVAKANVRRALVDTEILGCKIPKGAEIIMNYHLNRDPVPVEESKRSLSSQAAATKFEDGLRADAGRDIASFYPRRWLLKNTSTGKETFNPHALPSLAFGGGYRGCAGRKLASMEFRIVVVLLVLNLEFLELPEELKIMRATEKIFRQPDMPYARVRAL
ncbi:cytochrome P450 [Hypoxylon trugodes]|uniref:cytochrome P450 n=1 Tax=Hypoxylon trugodes TaxID=326681 RepID=UPI00219770C3|nr:cytochrome P450 [Hypoxylon trugodes]KAI1383030.1 cytochrome P450 [Hypoxylon trugodes]